MKGSIFVSFINHVDETFGPELVEQAIDQLGDSLSSGGAYTSVGNYPHEELLSIAGTVCELSSTELEPLIRAFAGYLLAEFQRIHPEYFEAHSELFDFLSSLEGMIHADVRKIYPDAKPPLVTTEPTDEADEILLHYKSSRPLALLAMALTESCSQAFAQPIVVEVIDQSEDQCSMTMKVSKQHD